MLAEALQTFYHTSAFCKCGPTEVLIPNHREDQFMKKIISLLSVVLGCVASVSVSAATYTLNVNSALTAEDPMFKGLNQFKAKSKNVRKDRSR